MTIVTTSRQALADVLDHGKSVIERGGASVLQNVRLSTAGGKLRLAFTDNILWLSVSIDADADAITATTLPASILFKAIDKMEGERVKIETAPNSATLACGRSRLKIAAIPADQFPPAFTMDHADAAFADVQEFGDALGSVFYAAPGSLANHPQAVCFQCLDGRVDMLALDGLRMAHAAVEYGGNEFPAFNLPVKACEALSAICEDFPDGDIEIRAGEKLASFSVGPWTLTSKLIEGGHQSYAAIVSERPGDPVMFDPRHLRRSLERLSIIADKYARGVKIGVSSDKMTVSLSNQTGSEGVEEVACGYEGEPQEVGYSLPFLLDAISKVPGDEAEMFISSPVKRAILLARSPGSSVHLIGPMQL